MSRAAVLFGIDAYTNNPLSGCEADAAAMRDCLSRNDDLSANFQCQLFLSSKEDITKGKVVEAFNYVFSIKDAEVAVFYFAGHGALTKNGGFLVTQDATKNDEGIPMSQLIAAANASPSREKIVILDCCHAGAIDDLFGSGANIPLAAGVSILAACRTDQGAAERNGRGLFTSLICDALDGGGADIRGHVNVPSIYSYLDEVLTLFEQRPLLKTNVSRLVSIRRADSSISDDKLRRIVDYFPTENHKLHLDPSFEPTADPKHPENEAVFGDLQRFRGARLLVPDGEDHLYFAAMNKKSCSLTPLGKHYWRRVKANKI